MERQKSELTWKDVLGHCLASGEISETTHDSLLESQDKEDEAPRYVLPAPRLFKDLKMMETIFKDTIPTQFPIRHRVVAEIFYCFADPSGGGLGSMFQ